MRSAGGETTRTNRHLHPAAGICAFASLIAGLAASSARGELDGPVDAGGLRRERSEVRAADESTTAEHRQTPGPTESSSPQAHGRRDDAAKRGAPDAAVAQSSTRAGRPAPGPPRREPSVREVVAMAKRAARTLAPERLRELARRARLAGLAPDLRLAAERGFDQDLTSSSSATSDSTRAAVGDELRFSATLTFELDRLVFAAEEVRLLSIERFLASDRHKLLEEVVRLYFQRRRLLRERASALAPDEELDDSVRELEATLDALTDGGFSAALRE